jgi:hypothetical protein
MVNWSGQLTKKYCSRVGAWRTKFRFRANSEAVDPVAARVFVHAERWSVGRFLPRLAGNRLLSLRMPA